MRSYLIALMTGGAASQILSAFARALPDPLPMGSRFYLFIFRFANLLLVNWDRNAPPKSTPPPVNEK